MIRTMVMAVAACGLAAVAGCQEQGGGTEAELTQPAAAPEAAPGAATEPGDAGQEDAVAEETSGEQADQAGDTGVLAYTMDSIGGEPVELSDYLGRVVLIVNTASRCGLTPQYEGLQALYEEKETLGLVVLGFPANNFMGQEPGSNEEIAAFCNENYGVTFPMFAKISVTGDDQHPLFAELSEQSSAPDWNFTKYLVGRDGRLVERFSPRTSPDDKAMRAAIDAALAAG